MSTVILMTVPTCPICGEEGVLRKSTIMIDQNGEGATHCMYCFVAWYEYGLTDGGAVKAKSLELRKEGKW